MGPLQTPGQGRPSPALFPLWDQSRPPKTPKISESLLSARRQRRPAKVSPENLKINQPVGDVLHNTLSLPDKGKICLCTDRGQAQDPLEQWRNQIIRLYFQNINGLRLGDDGLDILDTFYQMEHIQADAFAFCKTKNEL